MDFLGIAGKIFLLFGVANRKSIAWYIGQTLEQCGATVLYSVRSEQRKSQLSQWIEPEKLFICDVERKSRASVRTLKNNSRSSTAFYIRSHLQTFRRVLSRFTRLRGLIFCRQQKFPAFRWWKLPNTSKSYFQKTLRW